MATISIKDTFFLDLKIQGKDSKLGSVICHSVALVDNVSSIPVVRLSITDTTPNHSTTSVFNEGVKLTLKIAKGPDKPVYTGDFRLFSADHKGTTASGQLIDLIFIYDKPKLVLKSCTEAYYNKYTDNNAGTTSVGALMQLCDLCGLVYEGVKYADTNDKQVWLNLGKTRMAMAEYIANKGYVDEKSCMMHGVTSGGKLIYVNLIENLLKDPKFYFLHNTDKEYLTHNTSLSVAAKALFGNAPYAKVRECKFTTISGVLNYWLNYGYRQISHDLSGVERDTLNLPFPKTGTYLPINREVKEEIDGYARIEYNPLFDTGYGYADNEKANNVHDNFHKASYQNLRLRATFTEKAHVLVEDQTDLQLFDPVKFVDSDFIDNEYVINEKVSGTYLITAKTIYGKNAQYYEKFELSRASISESGEAVLY